MKYFPTYQAYRTAWNSASEVTPPIPLNIDIELSSICNLKCPFCYMANPKYKRPQNRFFPIQLLDTLLYQMSEIGIPAVKFNWIGEPMLYPYTTSSFYNAYKLGFYDILVNTNGNYHDCKNSGLTFTTKVKFSLDSMSPITYEIMRPRGNLAMVLANIEDLIKRGHKNICLARVITKDNKDEGFKGQVRFSFGDEVKVSEHYVFDRNPTYDNHIDFPKNLKRKYCEYPSQRLVIDADGDIFPCCVDAFKEMKLGNIKENTLLEVWQSDKLAEIRWRLKHGGLPSVACQNCTSWVAYEHPYSEMVKDKEIFKGGGK